MTPEGSASKVRIGKLAAAARRAALSYGSSALIALLLVACGGGGDSPPESSGGPTATLPAGTDFSCGLSGFRDEALRLINEWRAAGASCGSIGTFGPTAAVTWSDALTAAAYGHSKDMADRNYFDHTSADSRVLSDRVNVTGYPWVSLGENIAAGYPGVAEVIDGWMASPGHCRNIMSSGFREIGMACAHNDSSTYKLYYTLDLATPR
jgi:uncharacterized protein YkwD